MPVIEEVGEGVYRVEVPLPSDLLLGSINSYVVKGRERSLIVDAGLNRDVCMEAVQEALATLGVDLARTDFFITHHHGDHFGLVPRLVRDGSWIGITSIDAAVVKDILSGVFFEGLFDFARESGFPQERIEGLLPPGRAQDYIASAGALPFRYVEDGDTLQVGDYRFRCLTTPGHSSGHACLYEPRRRILFSGDHVLGDITPGIQARHEEENPLEAYLRSLEKISGLEVDLVLPGHRGPFGNLEERIHDLRDHHRARAEETAAALRAGARTGYEVASLLTWNVVDSEGWESFPVLQKFFAMGEAVAHLRYLEGKGRVRSESRGRLTVYSLEGERATR